MAREQHELDLLEWVRLGTGLAADHVIFEDSNPRGPRPTKPYASVFVFSDQPQGQPYEKMTDTVLGAGFEYHIDSDREGTALVQIYGPGHAALMRALELSIASPALDSHFDTTGTLVTLSGGAKQTFEAAALNTAFEPRATRTFVFRMNRGIVAEVGAVNTLETEGDYT